MTRIPGCFVAVVSVLLATTVLGQADLSVTKTDGPDPVVAGSNLTYTITLTNHGPGVASTVELRDDIPANTTFVSVAAPSGFGCDPPNAFTNAVRCQGGSFLSGASATFQIVVAVNDAAPNASVISNTVTVSSPSDLVTTNNSATATTSVTGTSADIGLTKTGPSSVPSGASFDYTLVVSNQGPDAARHLIFDDGVPDGVTFDSFTQTAGTAFACTIPPAGAQYEPATLTAGGNTYPGASAVGSPRTDATGTLVDGGLCDSAGSWAGAVVLCRRGNILFADKVRNVKTGGGIGVVIYNNVSLGIFRGTLGGNTTIPVIFISMEDGQAALAFVGQGGTIDNTAPAVLCTIATFPAGASASFTYSVTHSEPEIGTIDNHAHVFAQTPDPSDTSNNLASATTVPRQSDLAVTKSAPSSVAAGASITYRIDLVNQGPNPAQEVLLEDSVPVGATFESMIQTTGPLSCTSPAPGATFQPATLTIRTITAPTYSGAKIIGSARVNATATLVNGGLCTGFNFFNGAIVLCQRGENTFDEKVQTVEQGGGAGVVIYNTDSAPVIGTLNRNSALPVIGISMEDGQAALSAVGQSVTLDNSAPAVQCSIPSLASGGTASVTFSMTHSQQSGVNAVENLATAYSTNPDPALLNNQAFASTLIVRRGFDPNGDSQTTVADLFHLLNYLFGTGPAPLGPADADGDGQITLRDIFYAINYLFHAGPAPAT